MRENLFRGKREDNGDWVEGMLTAQGEKIAQIGTFSDYGTHICCKSSYAVIPESVSEFTGLTDKNGKKIFEGDIVSNEWCYMSGNSIVKFGEYQTSDMSKDYQQGHFGFYLEHIEDDLVRKDMMYFANKCEVIGNIHDNPELLKEMG